MVAPSGDTGLGGGDTGLGVVPGIVPTLVVVVASLGLDELVPGKWSRAGPPSCLACSLVFACSPGTLRNLLGTLGIL